MISVEKDDQTGADEDLKVEYRYCQTCGGALSERIEYDDDSGGDIVSWLRYEYDGLNLLRIDEKYDSGANGLDEDDPWRRMNVYVHGPGSIGQIVKSEWYRYEADGSPPDICCDSGYYYYFYDAVGNVVGVLDEDHQFFRWEMDAFGNDLSGGNDFLDMDQPGPKEHLTGKMFDTATGLYYFHARWYDPEVGRFVSRDRTWARDYVHGRAAPTVLVDVNGMEPIMLDGTDLNYIDCDTVHITPAKAKTCDFCKLKEFMNISFDSVEFITKLLNGELLPSDFPARADQREWGKTTWRDHTKLPGLPATDWKAYCNPEMATDPCLQECTCKHEEVHERQGFSLWYNKVYSQRDPVDALIGRAQLEMPAYHAGSQCAARLLLHVWGWVEEEKKGKGE